VQGAKAGTAIAALYPWSEEEQIGIFFAVVVLPMVPRQVRLLMSFLFGRCNNKND